MKQDNNHMAEKYQGGEKSISNIAHEIIRSPFQWVLVLGDTISAQGEDVYKKQIADLARNALTEGKYINKQGLYRAIQEQDYPSMKNLLFGNICDGVSFLDAKSEEQAVLRKRYADKMITRDTINTESMSLNLDLYLRIFPGIILTTCQDETVEAFMEDESAMFIDGLVCTPYTLMTSPRWQKWQKAVCKPYEESATDLAVGILQSNPRALVKLYGSCQKSNRMLLSGQDFKMYFPKIGQDEGENNESGIWTITYFLKQLFKQKHFFFIGMRPVETSKGLDLPLPESILDVLAESAGKMKRYAFPAGNHIDTAKETECWEKYGITSLGSGDFHPEDLFLERWLDVEQLAFHYGIWGQEHKAPDTLILGHDRMAAVLAEAIKLRLSQDRLSPDKKPFINLYGPKDSGKTILVKSVLELLHHRPGNPYENENGDFAREIDMDVSPLETERLIHQIEEYGKSQVMVINVVDQAGWSMIDEAVQKTSACIVAVSREQLPDNRFQSFPIHYLPKWSAKAAKSESMTAEQLFEKLYIRRPYSDISEKELSILRHDIIGTEDSSNFIQWNGPGIYLLAMVANNLADFYDLKKVFTSAKKIMDSDKKAWISPVEYTEAILWEIMNERLYKESKDFYNILAFYGSDFPSEFLQLIEKDNADTDRKELHYKWKRAAIQLTNSGICVQKGNWRDIYRRIELADKIMDTAGTALDSETFGKVKKDISHSIGSSYFYLANIVSREIKRSDDYNTDYIKDIMAQMFRNLASVLMEKGQGYYEIRSVLGTEMPVILEKMGQLDDPKLEWKPELLYCLFQESPVMLRGRESETEALMEELLCRLDGDSTNCEPLPGICSWDCKKTMVLLAWSIMKSQSCKISNQEEALKKCRQAENILLKYGENAGISGPDNVFAQTVQIHFQCARIWGRMATIKEIARCKEKRGDCPIQKKYLDHMWAALNQAERVIHQREYHMGACCDELRAKSDQLRGEYYFKESQFLSENRRYKTTEGTEPNQDELNYYSKAKESYRLALGYYDKFPVQYEVQRADVMRSLGDVYCRQAKNNEKDLDNRDKCYHMLIDAYALYRKHNNLRGIADVLQSKGNMENFENEPENRRSPLAFYNVSKSIYDYLGDSWSYYVLIQFYIQEMEKKADDHKQGATIMKLRKAILESEEYPDWCVPGSNNSISGKTKQDSCQDCRTEAADEWNYTE